MPLLTRLTKLKLCPGGRSGSEPGGWSEAGSSVIHATDYLQVGKGIGGQWVIIHYFENFVFRALHKENLSRSWKCSSVESRKLHFQISKDWIFYAEDLLWHFEPCFSIFMYLIVPGHSCGLWDLVSWLGIEPGPPCIGSAVLATGPLGKFVCFYKYGSVNIYPLIALEHFCIYFQLNFYKDALSVDYIHLTL